LGQHDDAPLEHPGSSVDGDVVVVGNMFAHDPRPQKCRGDANFDARPNQMLRRSVRA
jgi:hypothetical protein